MTGESESNLAPRLRHDFDDAKLAEVFVEGERLLDPATFDDRVAHAVREAPSLSVNCRKTSAARITPCRSDPFNLGDLLPQELGYGFPSAVPISADG